MNLKRANRLKSRYIALPHAVRSCRNLPELRRCLLNSMGLIHRLALLLGVCIAAGVLTRSDWELRIGATSGRFHGSLEKGPGNDPSREGSRQRLGWWCAICEPRRFARSGLVVCRGCRAASDPVAPASKPTKRSSQPKLVPGIAVETGIASSASMAARQLSALVLAAAVAAIACRSPAKPVPRRKAPRPDRQSVAALPRDDPSGDELAVALAKAKARALGAHEAQAASTDEDETQPVARARQSIFSNFAIPDLRSRVAAKVTAEAQAAPTDEDETEAVSRARQSIYANFAMPELRGKVAAKVTTQARPAQADRNSVYGGAAPPTGESEPALAAQLASLAEASE